MSQLLAFMFALVGMASIALAMPRHWEQVTGQRVEKVEPSGLLRLSGGALLVASAWLSVADQGASFGALLWVLWITLGAVIVALVLAWWPDRQAKLRSQLR